MTTGLPSGLSGSFGWKSESTYGTGVVVDKWLPLIGESLENQIDYQKSKAIRAGRVTMHANDEMQGTKHVEGSVNLELVNLTLQSLFTHLFGAVVTAGAGPYTHTFTPVDSLGKSLTLQIGRPSSDGTINPFTYTGCKIPKIEIAAKAGEIATMSVDFLGQAETTATALAAPSFGALVNPFVGQEVALSIGGSSVTVCKELSIAFESPLSDDRYFLGSQLLSQPLRNGLMGISGKAIIEFDSTGLTHYARYTAGTQAALVATITDGTSTITVTTNALFVGSTPKVAGPDVLEMELNFDCLGSTDAAATTVVIGNADVSAA